MKNTERIKYKIGISIGDINGIGPEIIVKTFEDNRILKFFTPIIYGSAKVISYYRKLIQLEKLKYQIIQDPDKANPKILNIINCWDDEININPGEPTEQMGKYALIALDKAANDLMEGKIHALVTAPINKAMVQKSKENFIGQTEFIAEKAESDEGIMMLMNENLKVGLVTTHLPISKVAEKITEEHVFKMIKKLNDSLKEDFLINKPRIAVLGLNPHAGENGLLGTEETSSIAPAIEKANAETILAFGPFPADGLFGAKNYSQFDAVLAMYHDQGLAPFKAISFNDGVNYTGGLAIIRTSPDHGTAYNIAGQNVADEKSFKSALFTALDIIKNREQYYEMTKNTLAKATK
jgi:4-hydroxythreonine-4-phosphate dehydrogenase